MEFMDFVSYVFYGVIGSATLFAVNILSRLSRSIEDLNIKLAVMIEKTSGHEKWLEKHDSEIGTLRERAACNKHHKLTKEY